jgi:hypothetical protein
MFSKKSMDLKQSAKPIHPAMITMAVSMFYFLRGDWNIFL